MQSLELVNFIKKNKIEKKENIYENIDEMLSGTLNNEDENKKLL